MLTSASQAMIASQAILMGLAIGAVALRMYVRLHKSPPLRVDDYLILVALVRSVFGRLGQILMKLFSSFP